MGFIVVMSIFIMSVMVIMVVFGIPRHPELIPGNLTVIVCISHCKCFFWSWRIIMIVFHPHVACCFASILSFVFVVVFVSGRIMTVIPGVPSMIIFRHPNETTIFTIIFVVNTVVGVVSHVVANSVFVTMFVTMFVTVFVTVLVTMSSVVVMCMSAVHLHGNHVELSHVF